MRFAVAPTKAELVSSSASAIGLVPDGWNDFGFRTQFLLFSLASRKRPELLGRMKIVQLGNSATELPASFDALGPEYLALGQSVSFYERLTERLGPEGAKQTLAALNDLSVLGSIPERFERERAVDRSLLRFGTARLLAGHYAGIPYSVPTRFSMQVETKLSGFSVPHVVRLDFDAGSAIPKRCCALIGASGTGKTGLLSRLASALVGDSHDLVRFDPKPPLFRRVVAMSFGVVQPFRERALDPESYVHCGGLNIGRFSSESELAFFAQSVDQIPSSRTTEWADFVARLIGVENPLFPDSEAEAWPTFFATSSAGLRMYLLIAVSLYRTLSPGTLVLFDEPETHLHPQLVSRLMGLLLELLDRYDCFAVIATHSPIVVQSLLSSQVTTLARSADLPIVGRPNRETFGAGLSELFDSVFGYDGVQPIHESILRTARRTAPIDQVRRLFRSPVTMPLELALRDLFSDETSSKS